MPFHVRDPETDSLVRELARREGVGLTQAVKNAVQRELAAGREGQSLHQRLRKHVDAIAAYPKTGLKADKAFFDELSGD